MSQIPKKVLKCVSFLGGLFLLFPVLGSANVDVKELSFQSNYVFSDEPLTTDRLANLDPDQINPHRQTWLLLRTVNWSGLKAVRFEEREEEQDPEDPGKKRTVVRQVYRPVADGLFVSSWGYLRPDGPWFQSMKDFPCDKQVSPLYSTRDGAKEALEYGREVWKKLMDRNARDLQILLKRSKAPKESVALDHAETLLRRWYFEMDHLWRKTMEDHAKEIEWKFYQKQASQEKLCTASAKVHKKPIPRIESQMEPISGPTPKPLELLARAPAKVYDGLFTVRADIFLFNKILNGRFLVDSGAPHTVLSPFWLENQGIISEILTRRGSAPERAWYSPLTSENGVMSPWVDVNRIRVSGFLLPLKGALLSETDFFTPPAFVGNCCDGVLGVDFLRQYPVEFRAKDPPEVVIWPRENFHWGEDTHDWIEVREAQHGNLLSDCEVRTSTGSQGRPKIKLRGVRWETGGRSSVRIHRPWSTQARGVLKNRWELVCDGKTVSEGMRAGVPVLTFLAANLSPWMKKSPSASIGIPGLLGDRASVTLDLPHGRIWFSKEKISQFPLPKNQSGLELQFQEKKGERFLVVKKIHQNSPAKKLLKEGLKVGTRISQIDLLDPKSLDQPQIEDRLRGKFSEVVSLQWKTKSGLKIAPLLVRPKDEDFEIKTR